MVKAADHLPSIVTANSGWVGLRVPNHKVAALLLAHASVPLAAPSANIFAHVSPTSAAHVADDFSGLPLAILDDGESTLGVESTVIRLEGDRLRVLRLGSLPVADVEAFMSGVDELRGVMLEVAVAHKAKKEVVDAPGQFLKHYAPIIPAYVLMGNDGYPSARQNLAECALVDLTSTSKELRSKVAHYISLSEGTHLKKIMHQLYSILRTAEKLPGVSWMLISSISEREEAIPFSERKYIPALEDKITRACSGMRVSLTHQ